MACATVSFSHFVFSQLLAIYLHSLYFSPSLSRSLPFSPCLFFCCLQLIHLSLSFKLSCSRHWFVRSLFQFNTFTLKLKNWIAKITKWKLNFRICHTEDLALAKRSYFQNNFAKDRNNGHLENGFSVGLQSDFWLSCIDSLYVLVSVSCPVLPKKPSSHTTQELHSHFNALN